MYEVHYWPWTGRILTVHISSATEQVPITMEVIVTGDAQTPSLYDNTMLVALALAQAGQPTGELFKHKRDGSIVSVSPDSCRETVVRSTGHRPVFEIAATERETVWCEAHGGLANPHVERSDCRYPHFTGQRPVITLS